MIEDFKDRLFPMFKEFFSSHIDKESENEKDIKFSNFIEAFQNRYIKNNEKDIYFRKKFIKKYANYLFMDSINCIMSENFIKNDISISDMKHFLTFSDKHIKLSSDTTFITHPHTSGNLTGNTDAYKGVVYDGFVHDKENVRGIYIEDIDVAFIYNGNHSVSIGSIVDDIEIETSKKYLPCVKLNALFFEANIEYNGIKINDTTIVLDDWKTAVFFKMLQISLKEIVYETDKGYQNNENSSDDTKET